MTDWEAYPTPFSQALSDWALRHGLSAKEAAKMLRVEPHTFYNWVAGRGCDHERAFRALMTLLDKYAEARPQ